MTTFSEALIPRGDLNWPQKWLLCYLNAKALSDGTLSITLYELEHNINTVGMNILHHLTLLQLTHDLTFTVTKTPQGPYVDVQLRGSRRAVSAI